MTLTGTALGSSAPSVPITPLDDGLSARRVLSRGQVAVAAVLVTAVGAVSVLHVTAGLGPPPGRLAETAVTVVTAVYLLSLVFRAAMVAAAWTSRPADPGEDGTPPLPDGELPVYTVLVPLYREANVLPELLDRLGRLDYPADRLQILLLIEDDDEETRAALPGLGPPFEVVRIPPSLPRTKPKACNVGLARARGEFVVIYDAEDRPDPDQLRKAVRAFRSQPDRVVCVQAELQYWNPWTNWLTRCFAAEYATTFGLWLRGLDRLRLAIPLGGTSNHFRGDALAALGGWDPYNVTEDADLGIRIARRGWEVRMMASVTEEEANSRLGNWIRQRSRWIKGYLQTWLVHTRHPVLLWRQLGTRRTLAFHLTMGFPALTTLVNPFFWTLTLVYLCTGTRHIQPMFAPLTLYGGVTTMIVGNLLMIYCAMAGCMERGLFPAVRTMVTVPLYWGLMSVAAYKALYQLARPSRRHFWELTDHGLVGQDRPSTPPRPRVNPATESPIRR
ncbi:glycosyltransferase [Actinomadura graeca]|uniref:Glycosyltransferase n=1 Tax=Actinomadura graeca TaxID=2750812 RepID=A0ABX8QRA0_9ACTN|nr:glycosyltransferase family 2 protein [Actinomadura graeca]QXJ20287.1 glycosyltransferase [Actinomadura graeca]